MTPSLFTSLFSLFYTDINECISNTQYHNCHYNAICSNTYGSYNCSCNTGYSGNGVDCQGNLFSLIVFSDKKWIWFHLWSWQSKVNWPALFQFYIACLLRFLILVVYLQILMSVEHSQIFVIMMQHAATQMEVITVTVILDIQEMV